MDKKSKVRMGKRSKRMFTVFCSVLTLCLLSAGITSLTGCNEVTPDPMFSSSQTEENSGAENGVSTEESSDGSKNSSTSAGDKDSSQEASSKESSQSSQSSQSSEASKPVSSSGSENSSSNDSSSKPGSKPASKPSSEQSSKPASKPNSSQSQKPSSSKPASSQSQKPSSKPVSSASQASSSKPSSSKPAQSSQAHKHAYKAKVVAPTCTEQGYTTYTCACGSSYTDAKTKALGHSFGDWVITKKPTSSSTGQKTRTCNRCKKSETNVIPKVEGEINTAYAKEVIALVNAERQKAGLSPLQEKADLSSYAQLRSQEIVSNFAHERPDGANPLSYVINLGYHAAGENIALGQPSPASVMNGWMNSPGHKANIMAETDASKQYKYIGVGCYSSGGRLYWTQIFAG